MANRLSVYFRLRRKGRQRLERIVGLASSDEDTQKLFASGADTIRISNVDGSETAYRKVEDESGLSYCEFMDDALKTPIGKKAPYRIITYELQTEGQSEESS